MEALLVGLGTMANMGLHIASQYGVQMASWPCYWDGDKRENVSWSAITACRIFCTEKSSWLLGDRKYAQLTPRIEAYMHMPKPVALELRLSAALDNCLLVHAENECSALRADLRQSTINRAGSNTRAGRQKVPGDANPRILLTKTLMSVKGRSILTHRSRTNTFYRLVEVAYGV